MYIDSTGRFVATNELKHYGIKGMEWGKHNGPPYPLDAVTSARVRMNVKHDEYDWDTRLKSAVKAMRENSDAHPIESLSSLKKRSSGDNIEDLRYAINHDEADKLGENEYGRSYNCPNCAAAFDMVERGYDVCARPKFDGSNVENIESFYIGGKLQSASHNIMSKSMPKIKKYLDTYNKIHDEEVAPLREKFNSLANVRRFIPKPISYKQLDVIDEAVRKRDAEWEKAVNEIRKCQDKAEQNLISSLSSQGNARGIIVVGWQDGGILDSKKRRTKEYHAFNYIVEDGKPKFYDVQSGKPRKYNGFYDFSTYGSEIDPREVYFMRTDNLEPSEEITKAVYSRSGDRR